jgi:hypothetical protein
MMQQNMFDYFRRLSGQQPETELGPIRAYYGGRYPVVFPNQEQMQSDLPMMQMRDPNTDGGALVNMANQLAVLARRGRAPQGSTITPVKSGVLGLTPEQTQQMLQMGMKDQQFQAKMAEAQARSDQEAATEAQRTELARQEMVRRGLEEANRHKETLDYHDAILSNQEKEQKLAERRLKLDEAKAEREAKLPKFDPVGTRGSFFTVDPVTGQPTFNQSEYDRQYEAASIGRKNRVGGEGGGGFGDGSEDMVVHPLMEEGPDGNLLRVDGMGWVQGSKGVRIPVRRASDGSWIRMSSTEGASEQDRIAKSVLLENKAAESEAGVPKPVAGAGQDEISRFRAAREAADADIRESARVAKFKRENPGKPVPPPDDDLRATLNMIDRAMGRPMRWAYERTTGTNPAPNAVAANAPGGAVKNADGTMTLSTGDQMTAEEYAAYKAAGGKL